MVHSDFHDHFVDLIADNPNTEVPGAMSYDAHYRTYCKAFDTIGIDASKKTHLPRGVAARRTTQDGVQAEQTDQMGGWRRTAKSSSYTVDLPREAMRSLAGHPVEGTSMTLLNSNQRDSLLSPHHVRISSRKRILFATCSCDP